MLNNHAPCDQMLLKNDKPMNNKHFITTLSLVGLVLLGGCSSVQWREGSVFERNGGAGSQDEYVVQKEEQNPEEQVSETSPQAEENAADQQQEPVAEEAVTENQPEAQEETVPESESLPETDRPELDAAEVANRELTPPPYPSGDQDADDLRMQERLELIISRSNSKSDIPAQMQELELLLQERPESSGILYHLGRLAFFDDNSKKAIKYLQQAIEIEDKNFYAANLLGLVYRSQGQFKSAEAAYKQALEIWPDYATAWYNLGILQDLYKNDLANALVSYKNYMAIDGSKTSEPDAQNKTRQHVELWIKDISMRLSSQQ